MSDDRPPAPECDDAARDAAWDAVAAQRDAEWQAGLVEGVPLEEVLARLRASVQPQER